METTYYIVTQHGRSKLAASTDEKAIAEAESWERSGYSKVKRVMKETRVDIWEKQE